MKRLCRLTLYIYTIQTPSQSVSKLSNQYQMRFSRVEKKNLSSHAESQIFLFCSTCFARRSFLDIGTLGSSASAAFYVHNHIVSVDFLSVLRVDI